MQFTTYIVHHAVALKPTAHGGCTRSASVRAVAVVLCGNHCCGGSDRAGASTTGGHHRYASIATRLAAALQGRDNAWLTQYPPKGEEIDFNHVSRPRPRIASAPHRPR
jgi:hypothetical protein